MPEGSTSADPRGRVASVFSNSDSSLHRPTPPTAALPKPVQTCPPSGEGCTATDPVDPAATPTREAMPATCADRATLGHVERPSDAALKTPTSREGTPQGREAGAGRGATTSQRDGVSFLNAVNAVDGGQQSGRNRVINAEHHHGITTDDATPHLH